MGNAWEEYVNYPAINGAAVDVSALGHDAFVFIPWFEAQGPWVVPIWPYP